MKNTFSFFSQRNVLMSFMLTGFFFLMGMNSSNAQLANAGGTNNPYTSIAQSFGVAAYPLGHFDQAEVIPALEGIITPLKPLIGHGASQLQELTYAYVSKVFVDVQQDVAVEISLLTRLEEMKDSKFLAVPMNQTKFNPTAQLAALYNSVVAELQ
jgi:hypothetical protein